MLRPVLITPPVNRIVDLVTAKLHCRVDFTDDDTLITSLILAAESYLDGYSGILGRALINQTWEQSFDSFDSLRLPVGIASNIASLKYYDTNNVQQTLVNTTYQLFTNEAYSFADLAPTKSWPSIYTRPDSVTVQWIAGYGPNATDVPAAIVQAIKMLLGHWYENRGTVVMDMKTEDMPMASTALLAPFRRIGV